MIQINIIWLILLTIFYVSDAVALEKKQDYRFDKLKEIPSEWCYFRPVEIIVDERGWNYHVAKHFLEKSDIGLNKDRHNL